MTWDDIMTRLEAGGLHPIEETYMENYGKILSAQRPEFRERNFRCTYGLVKCDGIHLEFFLLPDELQRSEFMDVIATDPWWLGSNNVVVHFPECDPDTVSRIMESMA